MDDLRSIAANRPLRDLIKGDLSDVVAKANEKYPDANFILIHGCNCFCTMGAGLAKRVAELYPLAVMADNITIKGNKSKLGTYSIAAGSHNLMVYNAYTQYGYGRGEQHVNYYALERALRNIKDSVNPENNDIFYLIPRYIGCGLGGGNPHRVNTIIDAVFDNDNVILFEK